MTKQFIADIREDNKKIDSIFSLKFKKPPVEYRSNKEGKWFELRLADKTGEISAKYWGFDSAKTLALYNSLSKGAVISLSGTIQEYPKDSKNYSISIDGAIDQLKICEKKDYDIADFIATTPKDIPTMISELKAILNTIENKDLKKIVDSFLDDNDFMDLFSRTPAAMEYHQNYVGGLLEHTLNVINIVKTLCKTHPELNQDLTLAGAFLHDIGKMSELEIDGALIDISHEGMLIGHTVIGYDMLSKKIDAIEDIPETLKLKLLHIILSHNGKLEYGAPKVPQLPEAIAVHYADDADAKLDLFLRLKREANTEDAWTWDKKIKGHVYLE